METVISSKSERTPLYETVADRIAFLIEEGTFRPGERIPSLRSLSSQMGVSLNTVKEAYGYLEDRRIVEARPQSGYYVSVPLPEVPEEPHAEAPAMQGPAQVSVSDLVTMIMRDCLDGDLVKFGAAIPNPDLLPKKRLSRMLATQTRRHLIDSVNYGPANGCRRLRTQIARYMIEARLTLKPDDIITTTGGTEAVHLALRAICRPGDTLAIESPIYFAFLQMIRDMDLRILEIPSSPRYGMSIDALGYALESNRVNACMVISNFSNPLGGSLSEKRKEQLVRLLERYDIPLIEDDVHGDLSFSDQRPSVCKVYDRTGGVLLCSSFSKTLAPGYRVGWMVPGRYRDKVERLKIIGSIASAVPPQLAIAEFLANGGYHRHLRKIRRVYARNVAMMRAAIGRHFPAGTAVTRPKGGFILWVHLPESVDSQDLYARAKAMGISIAPGKIFSGTDKFNHCIRLNAAFWSDRVEWAVEALGRIASEMVP